VDIGDLGTITASLTGFAALFAVARATVEYRRQGAQKRAELFADIRKRLKSDSRFARLTEYLVSDDPLLEGVPFIDKWDFLGLIEEVGLLTNSGLIHEEVSHHMFAFYALRCDESAHFWRGAKPIDRTHPNWAVFNDYVSQMRLLSSHIVYDRKRFRF
jgi:hypothetical protein